MVLKKTNGLIPCGENVLLKVLCPSTDNIDRLKTQLN